VQEQQDLIEYSVDIGVTTFDHADIYGDHTNEEEFGRAIAHLPSFRQKIQLVTKCGIKMPAANRNYPIHSYDTTKEHIVWSVENSLRSFRTDYIDLLLIHRPSPLMDPDVIADAFFQLRKSGKVLHFGVSNFTVSQFDMLNSRIELVTNQVEASLLHLDPFYDGTFNQCQQYSVKPMAWSPLGGGRLFTDAHLERAQKIRAQAADMMEKYDVIRLDQVYLAWLLKHPADILPVLGTSKKERVKSAVEALSVYMEDEDWFRLLKASTGEELP
jgi:predicted oxidoreductase